MMDQDESNVIEPRVPDSEIGEPVAYGPEKPKRSFVPESATRRRRARWPWIVLGCLLAPCICCALSVGVVVAGGVTAAAIFDNNKATATGSTSVPIPDDTDIRLEVENQVGNITIQPGATDEITVEWENTAYGFTHDRAQEELDNISINATESNGTVSVIVASAESRDNFFGQANSVRLTITVPDDLSSIEVDHNAGDIRVDGVNAGALDLRNNTGEISYSGALTGTGPYSITSNVGGIRMTLPADTYAAISAHTDVGSVNFRDFEPVGNETRDVPGESWEGTLGSADGDAPELELRINVGEITIERQP